MQRKRRNPLMVDYSNVDAKITADMYRKLRDKKTLIVFDEMEDAIVKVDKKKCTARLQRIQRLKPLSLAKKLVALEEKVANLTAKNASQMSIIECTNRNRKELDLVIEKAEAALGISCRSKVDLAGAIRERLDNRQRSVLDFKAEADKAAALVRYNLVMVHGSKTGIEMSRAALHDIMPAPSVEDADA